VFPYVCPATPDRWLAATRLQESISIIRDEAYNQRSVDGVLNVFQNRFHVSLHDLRELFANQTWRHARSYGGHAWAGITGLAIALSDAIREERGGEANLLLTKVQNARHNTGSLTEKLAKLRTGAISEGQENICDRLGECGGSAS